MDRYQISKFLIDNEIPFYYDDGMFELYFISRTVEAEKLRLLKEAGIPTSTDENYVWVVIT